MYPTIYWTMFKNSDTQFTLAAIDEGLCFTGALNKNESELLEWAKKNFKGSKVIRECRKSSTICTSVSGVFCW